MTTTPIETTLTDTVESTATAKKSATKKPAAKKSPTKKPAAKKATSKKPAAKKSAATKPATTKPVATKPATTKPVATKPAAKQARKVTGIRPVVTPAAVTAAAAAAPSFLASLVEDFSAFDLRNLPSFEVPGFDVHKAVADVASLPGKGRDLVTDLAAEATKRGNEAVSAVDHVVTLVREAVGV